MHTFVFVLCIFLDSRAFVISQAKIGYAENKNKILKMHALENTITQLQYDYALGSKVYHYI